MFQPILHFAVCTIVANCKMDNYSSVVCHNTQEAVIGIWHKKCNKMLVLHSQSSSKWIIPDDRKLFGRFSVPETADIGWLAFVLKMKIV